MNGVSTANSRKSFRAQGKGANLLGRSGEERLRLLFLVLSLSERKGHEEE